MVTIQGFSVDIRVADFNGNGTVDFPDFLDFVGAFGSDQSKYDFDGSGTVDFPDFLKFASVFGQVANP
jgi:Ca2+-binding EF-hand superfamily protein